LREQIADEAFLSLIVKFLQAGHRDPKTGHLVQSEIGVPQGGVLSPILCNIVMHKFDAYMENYISKFEKGKHRKHNPLYQKLQHLRKIARTPAERGKYLNLMRNVPTGDPKDPNYKRMMYVRYADDFVILILGSKDDATLVKTRAKDILKKQCGAELNEEKTIITNMGEGFSFLGADIRKMERNTEFLGSMGAKGKARIITRRLLMNAPMKALLGNLVKAKMLKVNRVQKFIPIGCTQLNNLSHYEILKAYNYKINGIVNFYSFASNYSKLASIIWYLRLSCALTLARKNKLGTARKAFEKYGTWLADPETGQKMMYPKSIPLRGSRVKHLFQTKRELPDPQIYSNIR
jgi:hypothetical protein